MVCRQIAETVLLVIFNLVTLSTRVIVFNVGRAGRNLVKLSSDGKNKKKKKERDSVGFGIRRSSLSSQFMTYCITH